jgi:hypothetical protein
LAGNLEYAEGWYRTIGRQNFPRARTIPRLHPSNRTSLNGSAYFLGQNVAGAGIEPATRGFSVHCSAN